MNICEMQHTDVLAVSSLADKTFGKDFLSTESITFFIESNTHYTYVLKDDDKLIGFVIWEVVNSSESSKLFHSENSFFINYLNSSNLTAKLNQIAINEEYRDKGYGEFLFKKSIQQLPTEVDYLTSTYWVKNEANAMRKLLIKNGFESIKLIPNYWYNDSKEKNYHCAICGQPPCKCSAEIFATKKPSFS
jgi:ribosomal protein S18 acetylase RimI-like enzyme